MKQFADRKKLRLETYDYSKKDVYFVTICTKERKAILSEICAPKGVSPVGDGAHDVPIVPSHPYIRLTHMGEIVQNNLLSSQNIPGVKIHQYVIMPDHIHAIILLDPDKFVKCVDGTSRAPSPTNAMLPHIISTFKRFCGKEIGSNNFSTFLQ